MNKIVILTLLVVSLTSCVSLPKCSQSISGEDLSSRLIVYRKSALMGFGASQNIGLDECHMGGLWNGSYLIQSVPPGTHNVHVLDDFGKRMSSFSVDVEANKDYYLKWSYEVDSVYIVGTVGGTTGKHHFQVVNKEMAVSEMKKLNEI